MPVACVCVRIACVSCVCVCERERQRQTIFTPSQPLRLYQGDETERGIKTERDETEVMVEAVLNNS